MIDWTLIVEQIMEPRLDSALAGGEAGNTSQFNVLTPLSPEEVCWILDTALASEVVHLVTTLAR